MAQLILIRHAQASLNGKNYDQLSELGYKQAGLLGEYLARTGLSPTRIICGSLNRHSQTTEAITQAIGFKGTIETDQNWNEFDFKALIKAYIETLEEEFSFSNQTDPRKFFVILKKAMLAWSNGEILAPESWVRFEDRVIRGLDSAKYKSSKNDTILVVSSGGPISMAYKNVLNVDANMMIDINFQIKNSSFSGIEIKRDRLVMSNFNQTPHLDTIEQGKLVTYA